MLISTSDPPDGHNGTEDDQCGRVCYVERGMGQVQVGQQSIARAFFLGQIAMTENPQDPLP